MRRPAFIGPARVRRHRKEQPHVAAAAVRAIGRPSRLLRANPELVVKAAERLFLAEGSEPHRLQGGVRYAKEMVDELASRWSMSTAGPRLPLSYVVARRLQAARR